MSIEAALTGSGIAMGRKQLVKKYIAEGKLTIPFNKEVQAKRGYDLIMPRENRSRPGVKALTEWVRSIINE